ncbi:ABC transporter permease [candidate division KSB1 bacterium]|nr:ABC transporter permease [candidate division KSB1 bacterium]
MELRHLPKKVILSQHFVLYLSLTYFFILWLFMPYIANLRNLSNIASNMWPLFALVIGQMFVLIVGGIDLSQTSIMAVVSVLGGVLMSSQLDPALFAKSPLWGLCLSANGGVLSGAKIAVPLGLMIMLFCGLLIGFFNGLCVAKLKMPPFMVTLISMMFYSGLAIFLTASENITHLPATFIALGKGGFAFVTYAFLIVLILALVAHTILHRTVLGHWFYAVGMNIKTSIISGVPANRVLILAYMFSGFCAATGSILYSARLEGGRPTLGQDVLLDIIGAAVIGGMSLFGGKGKVIWAFYGVLFFTLLANSLNMMNLSFFTINIVKGSVILIAAFLDVVRTRIAAKERGA